VVKVINGVCDSPDLCGNRRCPFYNVDREAVRRYAGGLIDLVTDPEEAVRGDHKVLVFDCAILRRKYRAEATEPRQDG